MLKFSDPRTRKDAIDNAKKNSKKWSDKLTDYVDKRNLSAMDRKRFEALLGFRPILGKIRASNMVAKDEMRKQLIWMIDKWQSVMPNHQFLFLTLIDERFRMKKSEPILFLASLKRKAYKTIHELGMHGIAVVEFGPTLNPPDTQVPEIVAHIHAVCWVPKSYDLIEARKKMATLRNWTLTWGLAPTRINHITKEKGRACFWAGYSLKHPADAQNIREFPDGKLRMRGTNEGYRGGFALRVFEGLSQIALEDMIFAVGDGQEIRQSVVARTKAAMKRNGPDAKALRPFLLKGFWQRFWRTTRSQHRKRWSIIGSSIND